MAFLRFVAKEIVKDYLRFFSEKGQKKIIIMYGKIVRFVLTLRIPSTNSYRYF